MRLVRVVIENFGAIRQAEIPFGPGLNILYGPNDLGKSTLAEAIRLALLLPSTSTVHEAWVPWAGGHKPVVELDFWANGLYWRVRKEFGAGNHAWLKKSSDGVAWDEVAKGRAVDGKIREILNWGIPEPGGAGAPKGLPRSFLATALLSTQSDVGAVLAATLEGDSTDSGTERVAAALSALGQDPLFKRLIDVANERYDEAFTPKGQKKTSQTSVLKSAAERVSKATRTREEAQKLVQDSDSVKSTLGVLIGRRDVAAGEAREASEALAALVALREWNAAKLHADNLVKLQRDVDLQVAKIEGLEKARDAAKDAVEVAEASQRAAAEALKKAEDEAGSVSGDAAAAATVQRQGLELSLQDASRRLEDANRRVAASTAVRQRIADVDSATKDVETAQQLATAATDAVAKARAIGDELRARLDRADRVERYLDLRDAEALLAEGEALKQKIGVADREAVRLREARAGIVVPDRKRLARLRALESELKVARGKLEVGLAVTVEPVAPRDVSVVVDGGAPRAEHVSDTLTVEARGSIDVVLLGVATLRVVAGNAAVREQASALSARWSDEGASVLAAAAVATVEGLAARLDEVEELERGVAKTAETIADLRKQLGALPLDTAPQRIDEAREAIGQATGFEAEVDDLGKDPRATLRTRRSALSRKLDESSLPVLETEAALREQAVRTAESKQAESVNARDEAMSTHGDDVDGTVARDAAAKATADLLANGLSLTELDKGHEARRAALDAVMAGHRGAVDAAAKAVTGAREAHLQSSAEVANAIGVLTARRAELAAVDAARTQARLAAATKALTASGRSVTDAELEAATRTRKSKARALEEVRTELNKTQGALEQVGGAVASEWLREADEALELAQQQERDVEAEYVAWQLLRDTMVAAEAAQSSHLGQALAPLIGAQFAVLTGARYGSVAMSAQLATDGVVVDGQVRSVDRLSVGTREQLSTLVRLCLAERLQSALVLDDQLVQSDVHRLDWFRTLLREKAKVFQIVVLTCRPDDYAPPALPGSAAGDVDGGLTRFIGRAVRRHPNS